MQRRRALRLVAGLVPAAALAGCGFALQRAPQLPFRRIALLGFAPRSPLGDALQRALATQVTVVPTPGEAEVVLRVIGESRDKGVVASTAYSQVREVQLRLRLQFEVTTPGGRELVPDTELLLRRDMSFNETFALAKEQEEALVYRAMQDDIVAQVLRRLSRVKSGG